MIGRERSLYLTDFNFVMTFTLYMLLNSNTFGPFDSRFSRLFATAGLFSKVFSFVLFSKVFSFLRIYNFLFISNVNLSSYLL